MNQVLCMTVVLHSPPLCPLTWINMKYIYYCHETNELEVFDIFKGLTLPDFIYTDQQHYYLICEL